MGKGDWMQAKGLVIEVLHGTELHASSRGACLEIGGISMV